MGLSPRTSDPPLERGGSLSNALSGMVHKVVHIGHNAYPHDISSTAHAAFPKQEEVAISMPGATKSSTKKTAQDKITSLVTRNYDAGRGTELLNKHKRKDHQKKSIFRDDGYWIPTTFAIRGRALPVGLVVLYLCYCTAMVAAMEYGMTKDQRDLGLEVAKVQTLFGSLLGLLLAFRFNNAYLRWWDGRKAWDGVNNAVSAMARIAAVYVEDRTYATALVGYAVSFPTALKIHLRGCEDEGDGGSSSSGGCGSSPSKYADLETGEAERMGPYDYNTLLTPKQRAAMAAAPHVPMHILAQLSKLNVMVKPRGNIPAATLNNGLEGQINVLFAMLTTCETINNTPLPFAYICHLRLIVWVFLLCTPFAFASKFRWYALIICAVAGFAWFGVESVALELESPFGVDFNDLPLNKLTLDIQNIVLHWMDIPNQSCRALPSASFKDLGMQPVLAEKRPEEASAFAETSAEWSDGEAGDSFVLGAGGRTRRIVDPTDETATTGEAAAAAGDAGAFGD